MFAVLNVSLLLFERFAMLGHEMLPDFLQFKRAFRAALIDHLNRMLSEASVVSHLQRERHFEGDAVQDQLAPEGRPYSEFAAKLAIPTERLIADGPLAFGETLPEVAASLIRQQSDHVFEAFERVSEMGGCVLKIEGLPKTFDEFLGHFERFPLSFDDNGRPSRPEFLVPPGAKAIFESRQREWLSMPENRKRLADVIERKREEWDDRESHRELVD